MIFHPRFALMVRLIIDIFSLRRFFIFHIAASNCDTASVDAPAAPPTKSKGF